MISSGKKPTKFISHSKHCQNTTLKTILKLTKKQIYNNSIFTCDNLVASKSYFKKQRQFMLKTSKFSRHLKTMTPILSTHTYHIIKRCRFQTCLFVNLKHAKYLSQKNELTTAREKLFRCLRNLKGLKLILHYTNQEDCNLFQRFCSKIHSLRIQKQYSLADRPDYLNFILRFKYLCQFGVNLYTQNDMNSVLQCKQQLTHLSLYLDDFDFNNLFKSLANSLIPKIKNLQQLCLTAPFNSMSRVVDSKDIIAFFQGLSSQKQLYCLNIKVRIQNFLKIGLPEFHAENLLQLKQLQIQNKDEFIDLDILDAMNDVLANIYDSQSLRSFSFSNIIRDSVRGNKGQISKNNKFRSFFNGIQIDHLRELGINLCLRENHLIYIFCSFLSELKQLENLQLKFDSEEKQQQGDYEQLAEAMRSLEKLRMVKFDFVKTKLKFISKIFRAMKRCIFIQLQGSIQFDASDDEQVWKLAQSILSVVGVIKLVVQLQAQVLNHNLLLKHLSKKIQNITVLEGYEKEENRDINIL